MRVLRASVRLCCVLAVCPGASRMAAAQAGAPASVLLQQAVSAEGAMQLDVALDRPYALQMDRPRTPEAQGGRLRLARLLALAGDLPAALLQCQALRDGLPADRPERQRALEFATLVARRLLDRTRAPAAPILEALPLRGLAEFDEPAAVLLERSGAWLVADQGRNRLVPGDGRRRDAGDRGTGAAGGGRVARRHPDRGRQDRAGRGTGRGHRFPSRGRGAAGRIR